jgi:ornithine--oxo-acid transaminase
VEPIQGEAGVYVPVKVYLQKKHFVKHIMFYLWDEVQTGIARTGRLLATCGNCD